MADYTIAGHFSGKGSSVPEKIIVFDINHYAKDVQKKITTGYENEAKLYTYFSS